ncbi:MAG: 4-hydroxy-3-methylbut-2-enyl diphosphate reductase [Dehalococcoidia bacterium]|nr:4-hydroxy-3-methylbut-2-enyl diphosphate reductase [Dehalococcoidia bacterium]MSQ34234.1 4-hydroxy-3-methylbut-2-enyl diphosphate reductase [Dehalococcoidia bacterium]
MDVYLASPRGFCAGVVRAVDIVELALAKFGPPVYVKHQIVHNPHVVADLEAKGARTIEHVEDIPHGAVVVFSAHGSPPSDYDAARKQNLHVIDATCPLVTRVHNEAKKYAREGKQVILVGHRGHQEVIGTTGQAPMTLFDEREEFPSDGWKQGVEVAVLTQTTLSVRDTAKAVSEIQKRYPAAIVRNDICYATTNRQEAAQELAKLTQIVLVIGAQNSSNCNRLREVAIAEGVPAYLINGPDEMNMEWFKGVKRVGITSGASTPEKLVQAVVKALGPASVIHIGGGEENITFTLPRELRDSQKPANTVSGD